MKARVAIYLALALTAAQVVIGIAVEQWALVGLAGVTGLLIVANVVKGREP